MARLNVVRRNGNEVALEVAVGRSLMETLRNAGEYDILALCGGSLSCATCHVHVDPAFAEMVGPAGSEEADLLEMSDHLVATSRLSCQVPFTEALDGLRIRVAPED